MIRVTAALITTAAMGVPFFATGRDAPVAVVALPFAPAGAAVRAALDAGGALVSLDAAGRFAVVQPPPGDAPYRVKGPVFLVPAPSGFGCASARVASL
ncbi:MAG: hypothetical protein EBZ50_08800 [Alphaproteobacteria bacterium]|nr:hypothetical protein [Alphaproteobacteria bacterium]